jgi:NitT/TauT family transport system substrate-binding protein
MKLTGLGKAVALILVAGVAYGAYKWFYAKPSNGGDGSGGGGIFSTDAPGRSQSRPLRVGIVTWPGYAGGIVANDGFKPNNTSIYGRDGLWVEFTLQEDVDVRNKLFAKGGKDGLDIVWSTVDYWANELPGFVKNGINAKAIMQVDWSRGGDAIVADQSVQKIEDLRGKSIALAQFTPSHWLLEYSLRNSSLDSAAQSEIYNKLVFKTASPDALADFVGRKVDAAVVWEPDVEASKQRPNSHVVNSTKYATNIIADLMVARDELIKAHPDVIKAFIKGWLEGTVAANRDPNKVVTLLMENEPVYKELGAERTKATLPTVKWADMADNALMFGLGGEKPRFDDIFDEAGKAWTVRGYITSTLPPAQAKDDRFLRELYKEMPPAVAVEPCGPKPKGQPGTVVLSTKWVPIQFASGSDALDDTAKKTIEDQIKLLAETYAESYIRVEGNTDNVGPADFNKALSERRAKSVIKYLEQQYKCHPERFIAKGNGPDKQVALNTTAEGRAKNRRTDIVVLRGQ